MSRTIQMRIYTIQEGQMDQWLELWRSGVKPIREKVGFRVPQAWVVAQENKFVWLLSYEGPGTFAEHDAAYFASPERKALDPDPATLIIHSEQWFVTPIEG